MKKSLFALPLILALGASGAFAQETTTQSEPETPAAEATPPAAPRLPTGEPVTPEAPQTYVRETFGDWDLQCLSVESGDEPCQMYQLLKDQNGSNVAEVSIFRVSNGGQVVAGGTFVAPLETLLTARLTVAVDGGQAKRYDFSFCTPVGCYARVGFTSEDVARFRAGANAAVTIVPALAPDQQVTVNMSLNGFTAAYAETSELSQ